MNKKVLFLVLLGAILIALILRRCDNKKKGEINNVALTPQENTAIIVNTDTGEVTTITRGNQNRTGIRGALLRGRNPQPSTVLPDVVKRTDGARDIRISIDEKGNVKYTFRTWGYEFSPEAGVCYASSHPGVTLNNSFFFYKKHEALIGLRFTLTGSKEIRPYIGYAYSPKFKYLSNTSLVLGLDLDKAFVIGTSTKF